MIDASREEPRNKECPGCHIIISAQDRFCRSCGLALRDDADTIDAYLAMVIPPRVDAAIGARTKDQKLVEVEVFEQLTERAMSWLKTFGFFVGIPLALAAAIFSFFGIKTWADIEAISQRAEKLSAQLNGPEAQIRTETTQVAKLTGEMDAMRNKLASARLSLASEIAKIGAQQKVTESQVKQLLTQSQKATIRSIVQKFEPYGYDTAVFDTSGDVRFGIGEWSTSGGSLAIIFQNYIANPGAKYRSEVGSILSRISRGDPTLTHDPGLVSLLRKAGGDPAMQEVQDDAFDKQFLTPALDKSASLGLKLPLSIAAIVDTLIQGGLPKILAITAAKTAGTPATGADEKPWIKAFLVSRREYIVRVFSGRYPPTEVAKLAARPDYFLNLTKRGDWTLDSASSAVTKQNQH